MVKERIDITCASTLLLHELEELLIEHDQEVYDDAEVMCADIRNYPIIAKDNYEGIWCGHSTPVGCTITLKDFLVKYGKPKYSLGDLYLR